MEGPQNRKVPEDDATPDESSSRRRRTRWPVEVAKTLIATVVIFLVVQVFVAQPYEVQQSSMRSTLEEGQYVLVDKLTPHLGGYSRGDIIVFNSVPRPGSCSDPMASPATAQTPFIKRVIGEPGDLIELRDGRVYVNEAPIFEPYVGRYRTGALSSQASWVVPPGRLLVMGDNREDSVDSRSDQVGLICVNDVVGRAFLRYWPPSAFGILARPAYSGGASAGPTQAPARPTLPRASGVPASHATSTTPPATPAAVARLRVEVIERRPHDVTSFTQGLAMSDGRLYEGSGLYGQSTLREVDPRTGAVLRSIELDGRYFGEGIAVVDDRVIQLTWQEGTALVYRLSDFRQLEMFTYDTEGWGLCDDGRRLVMSDGTSRLYFRDRSTFELLETVSVTSAGAPVDQLNELECVDGHVYANVFGTESIMRIQPSSGTVDAIIDASGLLAPEEGSGEEGAVLNGIAYDSRSGTFLLTGKFWPALFEVRFVPD
jgi:glutaminyl-peptide cyclotransferase